MIKTDEREIDGIRFIVTAFPAWDALHLKARFGVILAPTVADLIARFGSDAFKNGGKITEMDVDQVLPMLGPAITNLMTSIKPDEFVSICTTMFQNTIAVLPGPPLKKVDMTKGGKQAFNEVFTGEINTMYKAMWMVLQVNDFFGLGGIGKLAGIIGQAKAKLAPASDPPKAS